MTAWKQAPADEFAVELESTRKRVSASLHTLATYRQPTSRNWHQVEEVFTKAGEALGLAIRDVTSPRDIHGQARAFGVSLALVDQSKFEGDLLPLGKTLTIRIPTWQPLTRARSTLAHEFGHTFFWVQRRGRWERLLVYTDTASPQWEEKVCWRFARSYLLPRTLLKGWVSLSPRPAGRAVRSFADSNGISLEMLFVRLEDEHLLPNAALASTNRLDNGEVRCSVFFGSEASRIVGEQVSDPKRFLDNLLRTPQGFAEATDFLKRHGFEVIADTVTTRTPTTGVVAAFLQTSVPEESDDRPTEQRG